MSQKRMKFTNGFCTEIEYETLTEALRFFSEVNGDAVMGELREHTTKRSALPEGLVERVGLIMEIDEFRVRLMELHWTRAMTTIYVLPEALLTPLKHYLEMSTAMLDDAVKGQDYPGIDHTTKEMGHCARLLEKIEATVATLAEAA